MALYGRDANGNDAYIRGTGTGSVSDGYLTAHDVLTDELKFAASTITASADSIPAVSGKKLRVMSLVLSASAACTLKFQTNATSDVSGTFYLPANGTINISNPLGLFETDAGEKLNIVQTGTANVGVSISYREV